MDWDRLITVEQMEEATAALLETGKKVGADSWQQRVKNQTPHCGFGEAGTCCRICSMKVAITGKGGVGKTTLASTLARLYADEGRTVLAADVDPDANLGLALGLSEEEVNAIVPICKMRTLVEERTGANDANKFFKLNPQVSDIPDKYSREINGVKLLVMIEVQNLTKRFDDFPALDGLSLTVPQGSVYGLIGPNGAGKTTVIRHITGIYRPDSGNVRIDGLPVYENTAVKSRMAFIPDEIYVPGSVTVRDMMQFWRGVYPRFDASRFSALRDVFQLSETKPFRRFSKGMDYQKLQNGSDIRGVALEGIEGQHVNLTEQACRDIGRGFALWLRAREPDKTDFRVAVGRDSRLSGETLSGWICQAMTSGSSGQLPARSPMPLTVTCAQQAPAFSAAIVVATERPKSSWKCASTGFPTRRRSSLTVYAAPSGENAPNVSTSAMEST